MWIAWVMLLAVALTGCGSSNDSDKLIAPQDATGADLATTTSGYVRGSLEDGIFTFKGVRYGAPTGGDNRFLPPRAPAAWDDVRDATAFGARCPQINPPPTPAYASWATDLPQSEDCLFLNVWTPALRDGGKRPVMVWFHGGGFATGAGSSPVYDGVRLARKGNIVLVTVNHRLNVFGYLYLAQLGGEQYADSGNVGQLDLIAALEWVRDNIAEFGGDPGNVMIFGESGGGRKVTHMLATPAADGLFNKAAIQSGVTLESAVTPESATTNARTLLAAMKLSETDVDKLRTLPTQALLDGLQEMTKGMPVGFEPVIDGRTVPRHPFAPDAPAISADVPVIVGNNKDETTVLFPTPDLFTLDWKGLETRLAPQLPGKNVAAVIAGMRKLRPQASPTDIYFTVTTEAAYGARTYSLASRKAALGEAPVWVYRLEWETPVEGGRLKTPHALDLPLVFDTVASSPSIIGDGATDAQRVADMMSAYWISFARDGDPNSPDLPQWPAYDDRRKATMVFNVESAAKDDPVGDVRAIVLPD